MQKGQVDDYVICKLFFITLQYIYAVLCTCKTHYNQETCKCLEIVFYSMDMRQCQNCTSDEEIEMEFKNDINMDITIELMITFNNYRHCYIRDYCIGAII